MLDQTTVREATRLNARAGQLIEATALLQRMLRGEMTQDRRPTAPPRLLVARLEPPTIDAKAHVVDERESRQPTQAASAPPRRKSPRAVR